MKFEPEFYTRCSAALAVNSVNQTLTHPWHGSTGQALGPCWEHIHPGQRDRGPVAASNERGGPGSTTSLAGAPCTHTRPASPRCPLTQHRHGPHSHLPPPPVPQRCRATAQPRVGTNDHAGHSPTQAQTPYPQAAQGTGGSDPAPH